MKKHRLSPLQRIRAARTALRARLQRQAVAAHPAAFIEQIEGVEAAVTTDASAQRILAVRLRALADAEARVHAGRYGICETCGRRIPARRLAALPEARHCVGCAEVAEGHANRGVAMHQVVT